MKTILIVIAHIFTFSVVLFAQNFSDETLAKVRQQDIKSRDQVGKLQTLTASEHSYRADVYYSNRVFPEAREHWSKIIENYPNDTNIPKSLFGIARSLMWERQYDKAVFWFDKLTADYLDTKEGREGLAYKGASLVRLGKNEEAAAIYKQYTVMFPTGEKIESAYLNIIDALREAEKYAEANEWVEKSRTRFTGMPTATNALHSRLRMEIFRGNWVKAIEAADDLIKLRNFSGSMTSSDEVIYLKGYALEKAGKKSEAISIFSLIPDSYNSYYGWSAFEKLKVLNPGNSNKQPPISAELSKNYPLMFRAELLKYAKPKKIDPRFVLAIMKQESSFRPNAKSPSAARGLLQLVFDTALKYNKQAGIENLAPDDLYKPNVNIAIGCEYIAALKNQFGGLYEAIAASYNGGEDNATRWLERSKPKDAAIFSSEVGFAETKKYVFKVMNNYRVYRDLYTEDLLLKK